MLRWTRPSICHARVHAATRPSPGSRNTFCRASCSIRPVRRTVRSATYRCKRLSIRCSGQFSFSAVYFLTGSHQGVKHDHPSHQRPQSIQRQSESHHRRPRHVRTRCRDASRHRDICHYHAFGQRPRSGHWQRSRRPGESDGSLDCQALNAGIVARNGGCTMNFQQLRSIREAARCGFNLTEVANVLFTSQPGVSRQIRELEDELGVEIFERNGKRLTGLTEPGKEILHIIERLLLEEQNLRHASQEYAEEQSGTLTIATTHTQARYMLPRVVQAFRVAFPQVRIALQQSAPEHIAEWVISGKADVGIATEGLSRR